MNEDQPFVERLADAPWPDRPAASNDLGQGEGL